MACITANIAGVRPATSRAALAGPRRVAARVARTRAPNASASASSSSSVAAPSERLALAAASVGRVFRAAQTQTQTTTTTPPAPAVAPPPSLFARAREFASEQSAKGRAMAKDLGVQDATLLFVTAAAMSYKEKKMVALITSAVGSFIKLYLLLLFVRVLLTWFPNVDWMRQPWSILRQITDPYLNLFRNLIPPIMGQIDFTPILGFMVLQFLAKVLSSDPSVGRF